MDDEAGKSEADAPWYVRGKGILSREETQAAARFAVALREAARGLAQVGGARWALDVLREEVSAIEGPAKRGAGRPPRPARASDLELILLVNALPHESAPKLAARLHRGAPGEHGATAGAIEKRIKTIRALPPEARKVMTRAALIENGRAFIAERRASGDMTTEEAALFLETWGMLADPETLNPETRAFLADLMRRAGWGNQSD